MPGEFVSQIDRRFRRQLLGLLFTGLLWCGCRSQRTDSQAQPAAAAEPQQRPELVVHLGYQKIGTPFLLKARAESLEKQLQAHQARAEWIEFPAGPPLLEAMRAGAVDIGYTGETPPVFAQAGGVPLVYAAADPPSPESEAIVVPKGSQLQTLADLKGKRVALNRGSNVHYLLVKALESVKLTLQDLSVVYLAPADARSAFDSGQVDAWVIWDPFLAAAELNGARTLRDGKGLVQNDFFYLVRREFGEREPELVHSVLEEYRSLSEWAGGHAEEASRLLAQSSGVAYEALLRSEHRHFYGLRPITPQLLQKQQAIADTFQQLQLLPKAIRIEEAFLPVAAYTASR
jgi:sulfonate transport system substrate-binding protein